MKSLRHHLQIACGYTFLERVHGRALDAFQAHIEPLNKSQEQYSGLKEIILALFRGGWKSTLIAGVVTWFIANDRNWRGQLIGSTYVPSCDRVDRARKLLELPRMEAIYGSFVSKNDWNQQSFTVSGRTEVFAEATYSAQSRESYKPGGHFDFVAIDDFEDQDTTNTRALIEMGRRVESLIYPTCDRPKSLMVTVGTFWDDADILNHKINKYKLFEESEVEGIKRKRIVSGKMSPNNKAILFYQPAENPDGTAAAPEIHDDEALLQIKTYQMSVSDYAAQYLLDPIAHENAAFKREDFEYVSALPVGEVNTYFGYDFAQSVRERADRSGIAGLHVASDYVWYVFEGQNYRLDVPGMWQAIFDRYFAHPMAIHCIEADNFVKGWKPAFEQECRQRSLYPIIEWIDSGARNRKDDRILSLQGVFQRKGVKFLNGCQPLEGELLRFPKGERKDIADALANVLHVVQSARGDSYKVDLKNPYRRPGLMRHDSRDEIWSEDRPNPNQPYNGRAGSLVPWKAS